MNWCTQTKGAFIIDYPDARFRQRMIGQAKEALRAVMSEELIFPGASRLFLLPPVENILNQVDYVFVLQLYREWVKQFFARAPPHQLAMVQPPYPNFLAQQSRTLALTFTYDTNMAFRQAY
jgi:hypothetical protein